MYWMCTTILDTWQTLCTMLRKQVHTAVPNMLPCQSRAHELRDLANMLPAKVVQLFM